MMKAVRLIFVVQIVAGCITAFFAFAVSHVAAQRYAIASAYERMFKQSNTTGVTSRFFDMTPNDFNSFASAIARDGLGVSEVLMFSGLVVAVLGVAGLILLRRASINTVHPTRLQGGASG